MNKTLRNPVTYILFLLPAVLLYCVFFLYPVIQTFHLGFTDSNMLRYSYIGFDNFVTAFHDELFWVGFKNNLWFIFVSLFIQLPIIIALAVLISEIKLFRGFYKTTIFMPSILSTAVVGILFRFVVFQPEIGFLNGILRGVGLESWTHNWLGEEGWGMAAILATNAWQWTGFYVVLILAAILSISKEVYEAADIDGASMFQKARLITLPLLRPIIIVVILLSITGAMKAIDIVIVMTNGNPFHSTEVMATYMYKVAFNRTEYGYGNAIGNLIFVFTLIITLIFSVFSKKYGDVEN
jgi:raffinose/stachyose/melibiose transport system permease protein